MDEDRKGIVALLVMVICILGGVAFGEWQNSYAAGFWMAIFLIVIAD